MEPLPGNAADASSSDPVSTKLKRMATLVEQMPDKAIFTLNHCLNRDLLLRGMDGQTYEDFSEGLSDRLDEMVNLSGYAVAG